MYTLAQLDIFVRVAKTGSFNKAAEEAYITPSAVMKHINNLEKEVGASLFLRTYRGQRLTKIGEQLYKDAVAILSLCENSLENAKAMAKEDANVIRIGSSIMAPIDIFEDIWVALRKKHPEIRLKIVPFENTGDEKGYTVPTPGVKYDVVPTSYDDIVLSTRNVNAIEIAKAKLYAVLSVNHRLADKEIIEYDDLRDETLITVERNRIGYLDEFCDFIQKREPLVKIKEIFSYDADIYNECANGNDIILGMGNLIKIHSMLKRVPIRWDKECSYGLMYAKDASPTVLKFISTIEEIIKDKK